jgi:hypothetical protein
VPLPTELASASDVRNGENRLAFLDEREDGSAEERVDGDVETAVSCGPQVQRSRISRGRGVKANRIDSRERSRPRVYPCASR